MHMHVHAPFAICRGPTALFAMGRGPTAPFQQRSRRGTLSSVFVPHPKLTINNKLLLIIHILHKQQYVTQVDKLFSTLSSHLYIYHVCIYML